MKETAPTTGEPLAEGRVALIYPWDDGLVVKLARDWVPADWISSEFRIATAVYETGLPVPKPHRIIELNSRPGILYDQVDGPTMLDRIGREPHKAARFGRILGELHARLHSVPSAPDLPDNHQRLLKHIESIEGAPDSYRQTAIQILARLPHGNVLLHGDFHPGNVILSANQPVIIDWPDASRGHPLSDVARTLVLIGLGGLPQHPVLRVFVRLLRSVFKRAYLRTYFKHSDQQRKNLSEWLYPVIFARFSEGIEAEREMSIRWLDRLKPAGKEK